jgi:hypothetical protein
MKKRSSSRKQRKPTMKRKATKEAVTIGMDLGDKTGFPLNLLLTTKSAAIRQAGRILFPDQHVSRTLLIFAIAAEDRVLYVAHGQ